MAAAAGPKGKGSGGAMQGRPLRCQHGRRWSQSARARWRCISWRSGGRLAVPGPKSDRAAPSWRGWVAQKSAAHHAMVPMQLHKHCHSRDLAERWRLAYCIILWPLYSLRNGKRPVPDQKRLGRPHGHSYNNKSEHNLIRLRTAMSPSGRTMKKTMMSMLLLRLRVRIRLCVLGMLIIGGEGARQ